MNYYIGIDVGTGSARVGIFTENGKMKATEKKDIKTWHYDEVYKEQSSNDIWDSICDITKNALKRNNISPKDVKGIGFDATCSLVAIDKNDNPISVSKTGETERNIILWMDHRAQKEIEIINKTKNRVLKYIGGKISIEMEIPKLLWLKNNIPNTFNDAKHFFDLPDYLVYKACGEDIRSSCSLTCKWTYLNHEKNWDKNFFEEINLKELSEDDFSKIGKNINEIGSKAGTLSKEAAEDLGLTEGTPVGVSMIDAHAGGVGVIGIDIEKNKDLNTRLALIGGTSNCHMAVSEEQRFIDGVWGPYYSAMIPDMWLTEGGQSAAGILVEHLIKSHPSYNELVDLANRKNKSIYEVLNKNVYGISEFATKDFHILPYHHGNRSPRANPDLKGMITGLTMNNSLNNLTLLYLAGLQSIALGTRHIIDTLNKKGYNIKELYVTGGITKNPLFLRIYSNVTGCKIITGKEEESVLLGAAILGAIASEDVKDIFEGMNKMSEKGQEIFSDTNYKEFYDRKYQVFLEMYNDYMKYKKIMSE